MNTLHPAIAQRPKAVLFDAYGTLLDVYSVALLAGQLFPGHGQQLSVLWRDKQIEYSRLLTTSNHGAHYQPFWQVTESALRYALKIIAARAAFAWDKPVLDAEYLAQASSQLMNQYRHPARFLKTKRCCRR
jgi:2-haloacid dehalogenase